MNKEVTKQKKNENQKAKREDADINVLVEKMNRGGSRRPFYWRKGNEPIYSKDFRNPTRH
tara:strand:+ start:7819 stop:7998 length:180 start_codon:yes stop_codon:yes gene_type:complete